MVDRNILKFIEDNNLISINSMDEALFSKGKLQSGFFIYLIIEIEDSYNIIFSDEELKMENFDTVRMIESMINKKTHKIRKIYDDSYQF
ncbi:hypothetical protein SH1V18_44930 [Vallitalea longa]|uniref:Carrier domain-containing protein n=1 Tax=Vallitalea longa TaxID=2936439 RepID=A0A9W6DI09_9FIRM|nr:hypothetical protein [Vallitalea longa]GKX32013.1 hypothetical protein SH1V18_44930 [Vallitalea longa]